jgi:hypothetical protein
MWGRVDGLEGVSSKLSFALRPKLLTRVKSFASWRYTVLGLEVHFARSYGGNFC